MARPADSPTPRPDPRAAVLVGGWAHPAAQTGPPLVAALGAAGLETALAEHPDQLTTLLDDEAFDLLVVHGCYFTMTDDRYSEEQRDQYRYRTSPNLRAAVTRHLAAGRPLLALHTAVLCFDDWPQWTALLGVGWDWSRSFHPPPGPLSVDVAATDHALAGGLGRGFTVEDERYTHLPATVPADRIDMVLTTDAEGSTHPVAWTTQPVEPSGGLVVGCTLGHDESTLAGQPFAMFLANVRTHLGI